MLAKEWEAFTPIINELIKSVLLQERAVKKNYWESGQLALRYRMVRIMIMMVRLLMKFLIRIMSSS